MSNEFDEDLATAMMAKMAGVTLTEVDRNTIQQSSAGPATKIDPLSFIRSVQAGKQQQQLQTADEANRLAEQLYPLPPSEFVPSPVNVPQQAPVPVNVPPTVNNEDLKAIKSQLERVNATLTKMSGMLGKVFEGLVKK
jgi:hypothetical protein